MEVLPEKIPGRLISRFGDIPWLPAPLTWQHVIFFLWGHLKSKVCRHKPRTLDELNDETTRVVREVPGQMLTDNDGGGAPFASARIPALRLKGAISLTLFSELKFCYV